MVLCKLQYGAPQSRQSPTCEMSSGSCSGYSYIFSTTPRIVTYDHRQQKLRDPVRSPIFKLLIGGVVARSVTTGECSLLYVFLFFIFCLDLFYCCLLSMINSGNEEL